MDDEPGEVRKVQRDAQPGTFYSHDKIHPEILDLVFPYCYDN
jgi:hypothetical protein